MKKTWLTFFISFILIFAVATSATFAKEKTKKKKLAIMDLEAIGTDIDLANSTAEILRTELTNATEYRIIERSQMKKILKEHSFAQATGCYDSECGVKAGKILSLDVILVGSLNRFGDEYIINIRIVDVETAEVIKAEKETAKQKNNIPDAVKYLADKLKNEISLIGTARKFANKVFNKAEKEYQRFASKFDIIMGGSATISLTKADSNLKDGLGSKISFSSYPMAFKGKLQLEYKELVRGGIAGGIAYGLNTSSAIKSGLLFAGFQGGIPFYSNDHMFALIPGLFTGIGSTLVFYNPGAANAGSFYNSMHFVIAPKLSFEFYIFSFLSLGIEGGYFFTVAKENPSPSFAFAGFSMAFKFL